MANLGFVLSPKELHKLFKKIDIGKILLIFILSKKNKQNKITFSLIALQIMTMFFCFM